MRKVIELNEELTRMTIDNFFEGKYCDNKNTSC